MQRPSGLHLPSMLVFVIFGLVFAFLATAALGLLVVGSVMAIAGRLTTENALPLFMFGWMAVLLSLLLLPSVTLSLLRLIDGQSRLCGTSGRIFRLPRPLLLASLLMVLWPLLVWLTGQLAQNIGTTAWFSGLIFPPLQILAILMPLWWYIEIGRRKLSTSSPQRTWSILGVSLVITPLFIIIAEILLIGGLVVVWAMWMVNQPGLSQDLNRLANRLMITQPNPEAVLRAIRPFLQSPLVIYGILALTSGLVPILEELLKPLALWTLPHKLTPALGFDAGILSGAGFALVESLGQLSTPVGESWAALIVGRAGTGLLHIVTCGLVGWGLACAWRERAYLKLAGAFIAAAGLHGIWNIFGLLMGLGSVLNLGKMDVLPPVFSQLGSAAPVALGVLTVILLAILFTMNMHLRMSKMADV